MKLNIPNRITLIRLLLMPVIVFLYLAIFIPFNIFIAAGVFVLAASTDFIDGMIARRKNMITDLGKFLDPLVDKLLNISVIILLVVDSVMPSPYGAIFAIIIISRELIIGGVRAVAASKNIVIAADVWGKIKTIVQTIAIVALMIVMGLCAQGLPSNILIYFEIVAYSLAGAAVLLTLISGINYIIKNKRVFEE